MASSADKYIPDIAALYGGAVSRRMLLAAGMHSTQIYRTAKKERWESIQRGKFRIGRTNDRISLLKQTRVMSPRSVVSHESAAKIHGIYGSIPQLPTITVASSTTHKIEGVAVRRNSDRLAHHVEQIGGVWVTTLLRTIFDLSYGLGYEETLRLLDQYRVLGRISLADIEQIARELCRRGKPGSAHFRRYVEEQLWRGLPELLSKASIVVADRVDFELFLQRLKTLGIELSHGVEEAYLRYRRFRAWPG